MKNEIKNYTKFNKKDKEPVSHGMGQIEKICGSRISSQYVGLMCTRKKKKPFRQGKPPILRRRNYDYDIPFPSIPEKC